MNPRRRRLGIGDSDFDCNLRIARVKSGEMLRQPVAGDGLARDDLERPALQTAELFKRELGARGAAKNAPRFVEEHAPDLGELDAASDAVEKRDAVPCLERRDGRARRRLGDVERRRGTRHVLAFGHSDEYSQLLKRHLLLLTINTMRVDDRSVQLNERLDPIRNSD